MDETPRIEVLAAETSIPLSHRTTDGLFDINRRYRCNRSFVGVEVALKIPGVCIQRV